MGVKIRYMVQLTWKKKSTMIKVLIGEVVPQIGDVWSHENARIAYIAQHAFHHIENHLDKTPKRIFE